MTEYISTSSSLDNFQKSRRFWHFQYSPFFNTNKAVYKISLKLTSKINKEIYCSLSWQNKKQQDKIHDGLQWSQKGVCIYKNKGLLIPEKDVREGKDK